MSGNEDVIRRIATKLKVLDGSGQLLEMDSLTVLDFVTEIEQTTGKTVPTIHIRRTNFESVQAMVSLLERL